MTKDIAEKIAPRGRTLLITLGSELRADDGVGPLLAGLLKPSRPDTRVVDAGTTPENIAQDAINWKPDKIILLDAADFGGAPGELKVIPLEMVNQHTVISTHSFPLSVTFSVVREDTGAELVVLGVQAASFDYREGLTPAVEKAAREIAEYYNNVK